jgi:hypothetical protein
MFTVRSHSRASRHTAWLMLVAWLFALTTGVVNACVLGGASAPTPRFVADLPPAHSAAAVTERHEDGPAAHHDRERNQASDSCLKFCDDESSALPKGSTPLLDPGVVFVAAVQWHVAVVAIANVATSLWLQRPIVQGPPLVIRLLRLTL